jgi:hypothetical protein
MSREGYAFHHQALNVFKLMRFLLGAFKADDGLPALQPADLGFLEETAGYPCPKMHVRQKPVRCTGPPSQCNLSTDS